MEYPEWMKDFISIDLEMTGLNLKTDRILEIGAVHFADGKAAEKLTFLVNPYMQIPARICELTGIRDHMVENCPGAEEVMEEVFDFLGDRVLVGHNLIHDYGFLYRDGMRQGRRLDNPGVDTLKLCRRIMPPEEKKTLDAACRYYGIDRAGSHRAFEDAKDTGQLVFRLWYGADEKDREEIFLPQAFRVNVKKQRPATKKQKEVLRDLIEYHKIAIPMDIEHMTGNEISRMTDRIISRYGRMKSPGRQTL